jgi:hypothetical protein
MRLEQDQLDRIGRVLNYFGLGRDDTATVQTALNNLENVLQGQFSVNLMDSLALNADSIKQIKKLKTDIKELKRITNSSGL